MVEPKQARDTDGDELIRRVGSGRAAVRPSSGRLGFLRSIPARELVRVRKMKVILTARRYTMLSYARLSALYEIALWLERRSVAGSFVECGVWNGGSAAVLAWVARRNQERHVWLFDSWEGMPDATAADISFTGRRGRGGMARGSEHTARDLIFRRLRCHEARVHLVRGWFEETIPEATGSLGPIALLHLDCDWYESVRLCLERLYDRVVEGGFIVVDDYGHWQGCRKAIDEFRRSRGLTNELIPVDYTGMFFRK